MISWLAWVLLASVLLALLIYRTVNRDRKHASQLNDYFVKAVIAHKWLGDEDAKLAAVLIKLDKGYDFCVKRLLKLHASLSETEWSVGDMPDAKKRLREQNLDYADALDKGDAGVFVEKYPELFEVGTPVAPT